jgi:hypothetical protein
MLRHLSRTSHEGHEEHEGFGLEFIPHSTGRPAERALDAEPSQARTPETIIERCVCLTSLYVKRLRQPVEWGVFVNFVIFVAEAVVIFVADVSVIFVTPEAA